MTGLLTCSSVQSDTAKHMAQASIIPASFLSFTLMPQVTEETVPSN